MGDYMESFFAAAKKLKYDGPNELIDKAGDTLSTDFIERLRRMADADQNGASDGGGQLLPTGDPLPAAGVRASLSCCWLDLRTPSGAAKTLPGLLKRLHKAKMACWNHMILGSQSY